MHQRSRRGPLVFACILLSIELGIACSFGLDTSNLVDGRVPEGGLIDAGVDELQPKPPPPLTPVTKVVAGGSHTCVLRENGLVGCWGANSLAQLGLGTASRYPIGSPSDPVASLSEVMDVAAGFSHTCAVRKGGTVRCWGDNSSGQGGISATPTIDSPITDVTLSDVTQVSAGADSSCARTSKGEVYCWGSAAQGELGPNATSATHLPVLIPLPKLAVQVASGSNFHCARMMDGSVYCWGNNRNNQVSDTDSTSLRVPQPIAGVVGATALSLGQNHGCVIDTESREVKCWGLQAQGQTGGIPGQASATAVAVRNTTNAEEVVAGAAHSCMRRGSEVFCWGANEWGQLGNGTTNSTVVGTTNTPVKSVFDGLNGPGSIKQMTSGAQHMCTLHVDGNVICWGSNSDGRLGVGTLQIETAPVQAQAKDVTSASVGVSHGCAKTRKGVVCWGENLYKQLATTEAVASRGTPAAADVPALTMMALAPTNYSCGLDGDRAWCWGINTVGQLSVPRGVPTPPVQIADGGVTQLVGAPQFICMRSTNGTVRCRGLSTAGQVGNGIADAGPYNFENVVTDAGALPSATWLGIGLAHACAVTAGGTALYCWGDNAASQLGRLGGDALLAERVQLNLPPDAGSIVQVVGGSVHTCVMTASRRIWCFGGGGSGQLGNGAMTSSPSPVEVALPQGASKAEAIAAGNIHTCAQLMDKTVLCWGGNDRGQIGDGTTANALTPKVVKNLANVSALVLGSKSNCALLLDGTLQCWGENSVGQLGNGSLTQSSVPRYVQGL